MADHSGMKLGAKFCDDERDIKVGAIFPRGLPTAKPSIDLVSAVPYWPMFANDVESDCAIAAIGHLVQAWTAANGKMVVPDLAEILRVFDILSPNRDGCFLQDVLNYWRQNPICGIKIGAYAAVNPQNIPEVMSCMEIFGGVYAGAMLPLRAQKQDKWDIVASAGAPDIPNSWGPHCIPYLKYDADETELITWAARKVASWNWNVRYVYQLFAIISPDWLSGQGKTPEGLDVPALNALIAKATA